MRKIVFALAALVTATAASALPLAGVDLSGTYFRAGPGFNATKGGAQAAFQLPGTDFKSRLGNEADSYLEINFADTMYKSDDGVEMKYVFMPAIDCGGHEWGNCGTSSFSPAQSFGLVKLPQLGGADIWIGQRYYQRHNIDNYDWFWWNVFQGHDAAGIENVDLGVGKLSFAIGRISTTGAGGSDSYVVPDLRFVTIPFIPNGTLEFGVDLALSTGKGLVANHSTVSPWLTAIYTQGGILGGDNFLGFQYASGAFAPMTNSYEVVGATSDQKQWRVFDQLVYHPVPEFSGELAVVYQSKSDNSNLWSANNTNILNLQVRPSYHFSNYFKLETDFWYSMLMTQGTAGGASNPSLFKATVAPTIVAGQSGGLWARPEFRLFATYATWSNIPTAAQFHTSDGSAPSVAGNAFGSDTNGLTLGAQVEAWW